MKKIFILIALLTFSHSSFCEEINSTFFQNSRNFCTKFLGIPVDGTRFEVNQKLKAKGFVRNYDATEAAGFEVLEGEFNGRDVNIYTVTNNNKVYRIYLSDKNNVDETQIKIRFNNLCNQFENNSKYISYDSIGYRIPDNEDISYEMSVNKKQYQATFYQKFSESDSILIAKFFEKELLKQYENNDTLAALPEEKKLELIDITKNYALSIAFMKFNFQRNVWFTIEEIYGKYYIAMFYDNEYNKANGEDL